MTRTAIAVHLEWNRRQRETGTMEHCGQRRLAHTPILKFSTVASSQVGNRLGERSRLRDGLD